jgi:hypothetical protein
MPLCRVCDSLGRPLCIYCTQDNPNPFVAGADNGVEDDDEDMPNFPPPKYTASRWKPKDDLSDPCTQEWFSVFLVYFADNWINMPDFRLMTKIALTFKAQNLSPIRMRHLIAKGLSFEGFQKRCHAYADIYFQNDKEVAVQKLLYEHLKG